MGSSKGGRRERQANKYLCVHGTLVVAPQPAVSLPSKKNGRKLLGRQCVFLNAPAGGECTGGRGCQIPPPHFPCLQGKRTMLFFCADNVYIYNQVRNCATTAREKRKLRTQASLDFSLLFEPELPFFFFAFQSFKVLLFFSVPLLRLRVDFFSFVCQVTSLCQTICMF